MKRPVKKLFKRIGVCKACGNKFVVEHKLRLYCDDCRKNKENSE